MINNDNNDVAWLFNIQWKKYEYSGKKQFYVITDVNINSDRLCTKTLHRAHLQKC